MFSTCSQELVAFTDGSCSIRELRNNGASLFFHHSIIDLTEVCKGTQSIISVLFCCNSVSLFIGDRVCFFKSSSSYWAFEAFSCTSSSSGKAWYLLLVYNVICCGDATQNEVQQWLLFVDSSKAMALQVEYVSHSFAGPLTGSQDQITLGPHLVVVCPVFTNIPTLELEFANLGVI